MVEVIPSAATLSELETVIERGLQTFVEVGRALGEICNRRLYREQGFDTFEDYCRERWGMERRTAYSYIESAEVAENVHLSAQSAPSLTQARELAVLTPEQQREVAATTDFGNTTVRELKERIAEVRGTQPIPEAYSESSESSSTQPDPELQALPLSELGSSMAVHYSSESPEWYTPPEVIARSLQALGEIDLDPCSDIGGNIPAAKRFTISDDGLSKQWAGRVYMNPPYGRGIVAWAEKLCTEYARGNVTEAIALVPARVDTDWFRLFREFPKCFIDGRLKFSGHDNSAPFPSAVVYLGPNPDSFQAAFDDMGDVYELRRRG